MAHRKPQPITVERVKRGEEVLHECDQCLASPEELICLQDVAGPGLWCDECWAGLVAAVTGFAAPEGVDGG